MNPFKKSSLLASVFLVLLISASLAAQEPPLKSISYRLAMSRPTSHLFEVAIEVERPPAMTDKPVQFQMPKWSPWRYAIFDFAKNVQEFRAFDGTCPPAAPCSGKSARVVTRIDGQT